VNPASPIPGHGPVFMIGAGNDEVIEQIREQDKAWDKFGCALADFLASAFPQSRYHAGVLGDAIVQLMTTGSARQIARLSQPPPSFAPYGPDPTSILVRLTEERDKVAAQLSQAEGAIHKLRDNEKMEAYADLMEATALGPLRGMLENIERQISSVQGTMEGGNPAR